MELLFRFIRLFMNYPDCLCEEGFEVERIVGVRGRPDNRFYRVHWRGYSPEANTWQHQSGVLNAPDAVDDCWPTSEHNT